MKFYTLLLVGGIAGSLLEGCADDEQSQVFDVERPVAVGSQALQAAISSSVRLFSLTQTTIGLVGNDPTALGGLSISTHSATAPNTGTYSETSKSATLRVSQTEFTALANLFSSGNTIGISFTYERTLTSKNIKQFSCPGIRIQFP